MDSNIALIKGIHAGIILGRELKNRKLQKGKFTLSINEFPQTIATITKGKRRINAALSLKIEQALGLEVVFFVDVASI
jgi:plasmid maintenance system antidote protein VapI